MKITFSSRVKIVLVFLIIYSFVMYSITSNKYIGNLRKNDLRHMSYMIHDSRNEALKTLLSGDISNPELLELETYLIYDYIYDDLLFSRVTEDFDNFSNLLYNINDSFLELGSKEGLTNNDYALLKEYIELMTFYSEQMDIQIDHTYDRSIKDLIPKDRFHIALNQTEKEFISGKYPILYNLHKDKPQTSNFIYSFEEKKSPVLKASSLDTLSEEQLYRREVCLEYLQSLFPNMGSIVELDFDVSDDKSDIDLAMLKLGAYGGPLINYRLSMEKETDSFSFSMKQSNYGKASDLSQYKRSYKNVLETLPLFDTDLVSNFSKEDRISYTIMPINNGWIRQDQALHITFDELELLKNISVSGRTYELGKLLNVDGYEKHLSENKILTNLEDEPSPSKWINPKAEDIIESSFAFIGPDGHKYYQYTYKISQTPFIMVKEALRGETVKNIEADRRFGPIDEFSQLEPLIH